MHMTCSLTMSISIVSDVSMTARPDIGHLDVVVSILRARRLTSRKIAPLSMHRTAA